MVPRFARIAAAGLSRPLTCLPRYKRQAYVRESHFASYPRRLRVDLVDSLSPIA